MGGLKTMTLKAGLLTDGIDYVGDCLQGVGSNHKEQNHGLFGWDFINHKGVAMPDDFVLSDGTVSQFRYNPDSPYLLERRDGVLAVTRNGDILDIVRLIDRPCFYDKTTASGAVMKRIAQVGGEDCFFICYHNYCSHFGNGLQCKFCNLVSTKKDYNSVLSRKTAVDIGETAAAAFAEGKTNHILLTGGCFNHEREKEIVVGILDAIKEALGTDTIPGTILPSATLHEDDIRFYRDTGIGAIGYSMEIWDEDFYRAVCPGKSRAVSHDQYFKAVQKAVAIFGPGNVYGVLVMGLEPADGFMRGIRALYDAGANVVPFVWSPNPGSNFEGHRAPNAAWYIEHTLQAAEIVKKSGVPDGNENHCYRCDGNSLLHDALRLK
ncbi:MAG: radical SAM protein [Candidatus Latescibacterota bacterium]